MRRRRKGGTPDIGAHPHGNRATVIGGQGCPLQPGSRRQTVNRFQARRKPAHTDRRGQAWPRPDNKTLRPCPLATPPWLRARRNTTARRVRSAHDRRRSRPSRGRAERLRRPHDAQPAGLPVNRPMRPARTDLAVLCRRAPSRRTRTPTGPAAAAAAPQTAGVLCAPRHHTCPSPVDLRFRAATVAATGTNGPDDPRRRYAKPHEP